MDDEIPIKRKIEKKRQIIHFTLYSTLFNNSS